MVDQTKIKPKDINYHRAISNLNYLQGKVLTVIEATMPVGTQLDSTKSLIKSFFSDSMDFISKDAFPELPMYSKSELMAMGEDIEKIEKEAEDFDLSKVK